MKNAKYYRLVLQKLTPKEVLKGPLGTYVHTKIKKERTPPPKYLNPYLVSHNLHIFPAATARVNQ